MTKGNMFALGLAISNLAVPAAAHHSFDGAFDRNKLVTLSGTVTEFIFTEPHSYLKLSVTGTEGTTQTWHVETTSSRGLSTHGWTPQSIKVGETLSVHGWPARDGKTYLRLSSMSHADGSTVSLWLPPGPTPLASN